MHIAFQQSHFRRQNWKDPFLLVYMPLNLLTGNVKRGKKRHCRNRGVSNHGISTVPALVVLTTDEKRNSSVGSADFNSVHLCGRTASHT